ncbi:MAG: C1 family peptidase [Alistipes sp.]|nr:C1 family peptidase [Alistipes sp.]
MPSFVHIFIGKEYSQLVEGIGRAAYKYCGGTTSSNISYLVVDYADKNLNITRLNISSTTDDNSMSCLDRYLETSWTTPSSISSSITIEEFGSVWSNLYNEIFTINNLEANQGLTIILHFPLYKAEAYDIFEALYVGINSLNRPKRINFMGYFDDLAKLIEPSYEIKTPLKKHIARYKAFRSKQNMDPASMLVVLQNTTYNGVSLGLTEEGLKEVVAQFVVASALFFQELFPPALAYKDVVAFGVASLQVDKYMLVDYLMNQAFCNSIDVASVNCTKVDVNEAQEKADSIIADKQELLSRLFKSPIRDDAEAKEYFQKEVASIIASCEDIFKHEKSITKKAAILAALLSKTECSLFTDSIYNEDKTCVRDLFTESINYFITNNYGAYFENDGQPLINPIKSLKDLDAKIINTENEIRRLSDEVEDLRKQITDIENVEKCFFDKDNGIFHFNDDEFRILPDDLKPELLDETYVPTNITKLPESVDLRSRFNTIRNQGKQGACVAFTITSIFEYIVYNKTNKLLDLSEAFLYYNARDLDRTGDVSIETDTGSRERYAIESLNKFGLPLEKECPYNDFVYNKRPSDEAYKEAQNRLLIKAMNVEHKRDVFKAVLAEGHPISGGFLLCESFFTKASVDGYVPMPSSIEVDSAINASAEEKEKNKHGRHEMAIVGYSDKLQCFIVRNSWGTSWGDNGYCYMPYAYIEHPNLMDFAAIITEIHIPSSTEDIENQNNHQNSDSKDFDVPTLTINDDDIRMRYYINQSLVAKHGDDLITLYSERDRLSKYLDDLTSNLASYPNKRNEFINAALTVLDIKEKELRNKKLEIEENIEKAINETKKYNIKKMLYAIGITAIVYFVCYLWNSIFVPLIFTDLQWIEIMTVSCFWPTLVVLGIVIFYAYQVYKNWLVHRENISKERLEHKHIIDRIQVIQDIIPQFKFKTFAAWHLLREILRLQSHFSSLYTKYISLINNLRAWYLEVVKSDDMTLNKETPNISLLDKKLADVLFKSISNDKFLDIDFTNNIEEYSVDESYILKYRQELINTVVEKLFNNDRIAKFNLTEHIVKPSVDWVKGVKKSTATELVHKADIFIHLSSIANPNMQRSEYLIAYQANQYSSALNKAISPNCSLLCWDNAHTMLYTSIATLEFDDCECTRGIK